MATLLRTLIDEEGWKDYRDFVRWYQDAARALAQQTGEASLARSIISDRTFERWYAGETRPQNDARRVLAHLFKRSITDLLQEVPEPSRSSTGLCLPEAFSTVHTNIRVDHDANRYEMGRNAAMAARRAIEFTMGAEHKEVGPETMGYLQDETRRLASTYPRVPLGTILSDLIDVQNKTFSLLESGRPKPSQMRDLYFLASLQSGMLSKACHDLGDPTSAMMQARTAAVCANNADHLAMTAWIRGLQSLICYWADQPQNAVDYARSGAAVAPGATGTVNVWLASLEARAAGILGDADTVTGATRRAQEAREVTASDDLDEMGGNYIFPTARQTYYEVEAAVLVGQSGPAIESLAEQAVDGFSDSQAASWAFGDEAGARSNLALVRLRRGDLDGAAEAVQPVLDLPPAQRNAGIIASVDRVQTSLTQTPVGNARLGRDLRAEIEAFRCAPTLALPRG